MLELVKKGILAGIGLGATAIEKVNDLVQDVNKGLQGKDSENPGPIDNLVSKGSEVNQKIKEKVKVQVNDIIHTVGLSSHNDIKDLDARLSALEPDKEKTE